MCQRAATGGWRRPTEKARAPQLGVKVARPLDDDLPIAILGGDVVQSHRAYANANGSGGSEYSEFPAGTIVRYVHFLRQRGQGFSFIAQGAFRGRIT